jgi:hypothetical protein
MCSSDSELWSDSEDEDSWDEYKDSNAENNHERVGSIVSHLDGGRAPNSKQNAGKVESKPRKPKKDRVQRTGWVNLNLTNTYGLASGWGVREGIRELMQNLYFLV